MVGGLSLMEWNESGLFNSFWNLPGTHLFAEMTTPAMLDASKMAPSEAGCCFPNLTTCILCTVASCKKDHDFLRNGANQRLCVECKFETQ